MLAINFLLAIFLIILTGYLVFILVIKDISKFALFEIIVLSFGLGNSIISFWMFFISMFKIKFSIFALLFITLFLLILYLLTKKKSKQLNIYFSINKFIFFDLSLIEILSLCLICSNIIYVLIKAGSLPLIGWDEWCNWGFKSRLFFYNGSVSANLFKDYLINIPRADQPLNLYLMLSYIYKFLGNFSEEYSRLYLALFFPSLITVVYYSLNRITKRVIALTMTFFISSIPFVLELSTQAYGDVAFAFYLLTTMVYLYLYINKENHDFLFIGLMFLSNSLWTKSEGILLWLSLVLYFSLAYLYKKIRKIRIIVEPKIIIGLFLAFIYILPWKIFMRINKFVPSYFIAHANFNRSLKELSSRFMILSMLLLREFIALYKWNIFWIIFLLAIVYSFKSRRFFAFLLSVFFLQFLFYFFIFLISFEGTATLPSVFYNTFPRLLLQIAPIAAIFIGLQFNEFYDRR